MDKTTTTEITIERDGKEIDVTVEGYVYPGCPAKTYGPPENCYPEEPPECDITASYISSTKAPVGLTEEEQDKATEALFEQAAEDEAEFEAARADNYADQLEEERRLAEEDQ